MQFYFYDSRLESFQAYKQGGLNKKCGGEGGKGVAEIRHFIPLSLFSVNTVVDR